MQASDEALWSRVRDGDDEAFASIFDRHVDRVHRQARRFVSGETEAEDVTAIVFLEAWRLRERVRIVDGSVIAWLLVTTINVARNTRRVGRGRHSCAPAGPRENKTVSRPMKYVDLNRVIGHSESIWRGGWEIMTRALRCLVGALALTILAVVPVAGVPEASASPAPQSASDDVDPNVEPEYPRGLSEEEYYALPVEEQVALKIANSSEDEMAAAIKLMEPTSTSFAIASRAISAELPGVFDAFEDVHSRYESVSAKQSFVVSYYEGADPSRIDAYRTQVTEILTKSGYEFEFRAVDYLLSRNAALVSEIAERRGQWADRIQGDEIVVAPDLLGDGVVRVGVYGQVDPAFANTTQDGVQVSITTSEKPIIDPESRDHDYSPWATGARLSFSPSSNAVGCTLGFPWVRWADGSVKGSTAGHCYGVTGYNTVYNYGNTVGTRFSVNLTRDMMLLSPSAGRTFAPTVFVGSPTTSTAFALRGASVLGVGDAVAFSGATTGSHTSLVAALGIEESYTLSSGATMVVKPLTATWSQSTAKGDSGGPWITSDGGPNAYAHGSHFGKAEIPNVGIYSSFIDINTASAAISATILLQ